MCNYGEYVKNEGKFERTIELIVNKMKKRNISATEAMIQMDIDEKRIFFVLTNYSSTIKYCFGLANKNYKHIQ